MDRKKNIVSIQLLFLFNQIKTGFNRISKRFQYSFCSYSTNKGIFEQRPITCFNTASVLIQQRRKDMNKKDFKSFNTASVLIQLYCLDTCNFISFVSIQLLFLFNKKMKLCMQQSGCFNTASVLIQRYFVFCVRNHLFVSIQLLFLFNAGTYYFSLLSG